MKIKITLKDPDGVYESIRDAVQRSMRDRGFSDDDIEEYEDYEHEKLSEKIGKWVEYGEYVTIEIDVENGTAKILPV